MRDMNTSHAQRAASTAGNWLLGTLLLMSLAPVAFYAVLGSFSRLMADDWSAYAAGMYLGGRDFFFYNWNSWTSSFAHILLMDMLAPLGGEAMPAIFPAVILILWLLGLTWLLSLCIKPGRLLCDYRLLALMGSGFVVSAAVFGLPTLESLYWHISSLRWSLPLGSLLLFLAAAVAFCHAPRSRLALTGGLITSALFCFVNAGLGELQIPYQFALLALLFVATPFFFSSLQRRNLRLTLLAGLLGTLASALLQLTAPGLSTRVATSLQLEWSRPVRNLPDLLVETMRESLWFLGNQGTIAGFLLVLLAGMGMALYFWQPEPNPIPQRYVFSRRPIYFGLAIQLLFVPVLWNDAGLAAFLDAVARQYASAEAVIRAGFPHRVDLLVSLLSIAAYLLALLGGSRIESFIRRVPGGSLWLALMGSVIIVALLALALAPGLDRGASSYLFLSALAALASLTWLIQPQAADASTRRMAWATVLLLALALVTLILPIAVGRYTVGVLFPRNLAAPALVLMLVGLFWGTTFACRLQSLASVSPPPRDKVKRFGLLPIACALLITAAILMHQLRLIPNFATYAREWDARHAYIIQQRERGSRHIVVPPISFDVSQYIAAHGKPFGGVSPYFYQVESIEIEDH